MIKRLDDYRIRKRKGQLVDLTGYAVKYEAMNQIGQFVRDDAEIVDAKNGVFSYIVLASCFHIG